MTTIYESQQLENFRRSIEYGQITSEQLNYMMETNQLSEEQLQVVQELRPIIGGLKNVGRQLAQNASQLGNKVRQGVDNLKSAYNQGVDQQRAENAKRIQARQWKVIDGIINRSKLFEELEKLRKMFPNDQYINYAAEYANTIFLELQNYLNITYPYMDVQSDPSYTSLNQRQQQQANAQADMAGDQMERRSAGVTRQQQPTQNARRSRIPRANLRQRQSSMTSESRKR